MLATTYIMLAFSAFCFADIPTGYRKVYLTSLVNTTFVLVPKAAKNGSTLVVQPRDNKLDQEWYLKDGNSTIQLANTTLCLDGGAKSNWKDMASIYIYDCVDGKTSQEWVVMADGRIALQPSSPQECLDLQYAKATANNPVGLYSCAGLNNIGAADKGINWPPVNATA